MPAAPRKSIADVLTAFLFGAVNDSPPATLIDVVAAGLNLLCECGHCTRWRVIDPVPLAEIRTKRGHSLALDRIARSLWCQNCYRNGGTVAPTKESHCGPNDRGFRDRWARKP